MTSTQVINYKLLFSIVSVNFKFEGTVATENISLLSVFILPCFLISQQRKEKHICLSHTLTISRIGDSTWNSCHEYQNKPHKALYPIQEILNRSLATHPLRINRPLQFPLFELLIKRRPIWKSKQEYTQCQWSNHNLIIHKSSSLL